MLLTDKKNRNYAYVSLDDILTSIESAKDEEAKILKKLFNSFDFEDDKIRISKQSKSYKILKRMNNVI